MTLRDLSLAIKEFIERHGEFPNHLLGDFIDDFRRAADVSLVADEPAPLDHPEFPEVDSYLAAVAETLCMEMGATPPGWVDKEIYFLKRPWFAGGLENIKAILLVESPASFRRRNLFVSANAMRRV